MQNVWPIDSFRNVSVPMAPWCDVERKILHFNSFDMKHILHLKRNHVRFYDSMFLQSSLSHCQVACASERAIKIRVLLETRKSDLTNIELCHHTET